MKELLRYLLFMVKWLPLINQRMYCKTRRCGSHAYSSLETVHEGITFNIILPSAVKTELVIQQLSNLARADGSTREEALHKHLLSRQPLKRFIEPSEIAPAAIYLASDAADAITGSNSERIRSYLMPLN